MDLKGSVRNFDSIGEHGTPSPRLREKFAAKTFKRRSTNAENLQRSLQLLDEAVSPSANLFTRTPRAGNVNLRYSSNTPSAFGSSSKTNASEVFSNISSRKSTLRDDSFHGEHVSALAAHKIQSNETVFSPFHSVMEETTCEFTTDLTHIPGDDQDKKISVEVFEAFKEQLKQCSGAAQVLELVSEYKTICDKYATALADMGLKVTRNQKRFQKTVDLLELLDEEKRTWQLVYSLFRDRLEEESKNEFDQQQMEVQTQKHTVWALSDQNISDKLFEKESSVRQSQLVVDWLETCSFQTYSSQPDNALYFKDGPVVWENTLHHLQSEKKQNSTKDKSIVTEMDPDAPHRQKKCLDNLDESDERRLLRSLFIFLRAGQLDKASELCHSYGQPWRAASLEGWRLLHDPNYEQHVGEDGKLKAVEGNAFRDVWKSVCWNMAKDTDLDQYERAMYASLSGNLIALLPVCISWKDYVWAYYKVMVDITVEQELRLHKKCSRNLEDLPTEYYDKLMEPHQIFQEIEASIDENVGLEAKNWYHVIQKHIILDDAAGLIENMYAWLQRDREYLPSQFLRLMAHLVLFLRSIGHIDDREDLCEAIVVAYVEDLIKDSNKSLVAFYVATLSPHTQVQLYSKFLEGIEGDERRQCLLWAEEEGLDVAAITKSVVESIRSKDVPSTIPSHSLASDLNITQEDWVKINAIDWLVFGETHRPEAIKQANALMRCFVAVKKYAAARAVFNKLPADTIDVIHRLWRLQAGDEELPACESNAVREYLCMKVYLDAVESFNDWFVLYHQGQPTKPTGDGGGSFTDKVAMEHRIKQYRLEHERWMHNLTMQTKTSRDRIYNVVLFPDGGWLTDACEDPEKDELRVHQLEQLRNLHMPALCLNLHTILHSSQMYEEAVQIADVIASELHQLYKVFDKESLQHLLSQIAKSSHCLLNANKDPLGYDIV